MLHCCHALFIESWAVFDYCRRLFKSRFIIIIIIIYSVFLWTACVLVSLCCCYSVVSCSWRLGTWLNKAGPLFAWSVWLMTRHCQWRGEHAVRDPWGAGWGVGGGGGGGECRDIILFFFLPSRDGRTSPAIFSDINLKTCSWCPQHTPCQRSR